MTGETEPPRHECRGRSIESQSGDCPAESITQPGHEPPLRSSRSGRPSGPIGGGSQSRDPPPTSACGQKFHRRTLCPRSRWESLEPERQHPGLARAVPANRRRWRQQSGPSARGSETISLATLSEERSGIRTVVRRLPHVILVSNPHSSPQFVQLISQSSHLLTQGRHLFGQGRMLLPQVVTRDAAPGEDTSAGSGLRREPGSSFWFSLSR